MGAKIHIIKYTTKYDMLILLKSRIIVYKKPMFVVFYPIQTKGACSRRHPPKIKSYVMCTKLRHCLMSTFVHVILPK
jgi:hypothetical protein